MLVLSRKKGESILIPDLNIEMKVVKLRGGRVRLGVAAADDHAILRSELCSWKADVISDTGELGAEGSRPVAPERQYSAFS
jgi:carbon storage regulator CsrA